MDYYRLLGVPTGAEAAAIRGAYMRHAKTFHPDVNGGDTEQMQALNKAYQTLSDSSKRKVYDLMHQTHTGTASLFYKTEGGPNDDLSSNMSDDEIDDFINTVYNEIRAVTPQKDKNLLKNLRTKLGTIKPPRR